MRCRDGRPLNDDEIAGMLIGLLLAGQHTSSTTSSWMGFFLARDRALQERCYSEQRSVCGEHLPPLHYDQVTPISSSSAVSSSVFTSTSAQQLSKSCSVTVINNECPVNACIIVMGFALEINTSYAISELMCVRKQSRSRSLLKICLLE